MIPVKLVFDIRYTFNGQEKETEITGLESHCSAEFWMYDSRIGRRWEIDPVVKPWESPFACFNGNPILYADPLGLDGERRARKHAEKTGGEVIKIDEDKYEVHTQKTFTDEETGLRGVEVEVAQFKDNMFERIGKSITRFENNMDNFMTGQSSLYKADDVLRAENGQAPIGVQIAVEVFPPTAIVIAGTQLFTGEDPITGEDLSEGEVGLDVAFAALPVLKVGKYLVVARDFHRIMKPQILKAVSKAGTDYSKVVGKNPDIGVEAGKIVLIGVGRFKGKTVRTTLDAADYLE